VSQSFVKDILWLAFPPGLRADRRFLVTLAVYLDASGPNAEINALVVAGAISTPDKWQAFSDEWTGALYDFEQLPYFHMTDFDSGKGVYENWQERGVKRPRFDRLLKIIERYVLGSVGASISILLCEKHYAVRPLETAYGLTASHCFLAMADYYIENGDSDEPIIHTMEHGDDGYGRLEAVYHQFYRDKVVREKARLGGKLSVEKKKFPPLQAADILAFEGWKQWARDFGGDLRPPRYSFNRLRARIPDGWVNLDEARIQAMRAAGK